MFVCLYLGVPSSCSYKLWYNYLRLRRKQVKGKCITEVVYEEVNNAFERALVFMHKVRSPINGGWCNAIRAVPQM